MTITAAAVQIGCFRPFIYSLINRNKLSGPAYPGRPPRNAPRVYQRSIDEYLQWKAQRRTPRSHAPTALATNAAVLDRLDELTRLVQLDLRDQRSRRAAIAAHLDGLVALTAANASAQARSALTYAETLSGVHTLFAQFSELADSDNDTVDGVLAGYREILATLLDGRPNSHGGNG